MNRIENKFKELKRKKKKAFVAFITAGDPNLKTTEALAVRLADAGVDILELGIPFSDPLADGPTIQESSQRALRHGVNLDKILNTVSRIRKKTNLPIALMTYYNPILSFGEEKFIKKASRVGVDGLIIPDLPPEEGVSLIRSARKNRISTVFFLSPTTTPQRTKRIVQASSGFIYYVSLTGVTGTRKKLPKTVERNVRLIKKTTQKPICVGFGISTAQQVKSIAKIADGVIVGSAIVKEINKNSGKKSLIPNVMKFVRGLSHGL